MARRVLRIACLQGLLTVTVWTAAWNCRAGPDFADPAPAESPEDWTIQDYIDRALGNAAPSAPLPASTGPRLSWHDNLDTALVAAQTHRLPVLVKFGADWCGWCKKLDAELETAPARAAAQRWVRVYIDIDERPEIARKMKVDGVPALRALAPRGTTVASQDGFDRSEALAKWLQEKRTAALLWRSPEELVGVGPPNSFQSKVLIRALEQQDANLREIAITRLIDYPSATRDATIGALASPRLICQLSALEVLRAWRAPIEGLDPWRPETIQEERLQRLRQWAATQGDDTAPEKSSLWTDEQRQTAEKLMEQLVANNTDTQALLGRLRRFGDPLLPLVRAAHADADTDREREVLGALRYWIVADAVRILNWPAGLRALASSDLPVRRNAAEALVGIARSADQGLLLELFSDADALVRETALRGLVTVGSEATDALAALLDDPSANVRAAVLKQLVESGADEVVPQVGEYLLREQDADLIVHAVRYLRTAQGEQAARALLQVAEHESWQVRAEVAETIGEFVESLDDYDDKVRDDVYAALYKLLDDKDAFVVSRALQGVAKTDNPPADQIVGVVQRHPSLADVAVGTLAQSDDAEEHLVRFVGHELESVRIAALQHLQESSYAEMGDLILAALEEDSSAVRSKAAELTFAACNAAMPSFEVSGGSAENGFFGGDFEEPRGGLLSGLVRLFVSGGEGTPKAAPVAIEHHVEVALDGDANASGANAKATAADAAAGVAREIGSDVAGESAETLTAVEPVAPGGREPEEEEPKAEATKEEEPKEEAPEEGEPAEENEARQSPAELAAHGHREWLQRFRAGEDRAEWLEAAMPKLRRLFESEAAAERTWAALALLAIDNDQAASAFLLESTEALPDQIQAALSWLEGERRAEWMQRLLPRRTGQRQLSLLLQEAAKIPDHGAIALAWNVVAGPQEKANSWRANLAYHTLLHIYLGKDRYNNEGTIDLVRDSILAETAARLSPDNPDAVRMVALALRLAASPDQAANSAAEISGNSDTSADLRGAAVRIGLLAEGSRSAANGRAIELLADSDRTTYTTRAALEMLAFGESAMQEMESFGLSYVQSGFGENSIYFSGGKIRVPAAPRGLTVALLEPLVTHPEADIGAYAAYFLVLLDEPDHLRLLMDYWQDGAEASYNKPWHKLVYEAVSYADASAWLGELETIYQDRFADGNYQVREFYWTIRLLTGTEAVRFRKRIRDDVGMDSLR